MATIKFREASPYTKKAPEPTPEDYLYQKYVKLFYIVKIIIFK